MNETHERGDPSAATGCGCCSTMVLALHAGGLLQAASGGRCASRLSPAFHKRAPAIAGATPGPAAAPRRPYRCAELPEMPRSPHSARCHPRPGQHPQDPPPPRSARRTASGRASEAAAAGATAVVIADHATRLPPSPSNSELHPRQFGRRRCVHWAAGDRYLTSTAGGRSERRRQLQGPIAIATFPRGSRLVREPLWKSYPAASVGRGANVGQPTELPRLQAAAFLSAIVVAAAIVIVG